MKALEKVKLGVNIKCFFLVSITLKDNNLKLTDNSIFEGFITSVGGVLVWWQD